MQNEYYIKQASKLNRTFDKYLQKLTGSLISNFGHDKTSSIISEAQKSYPNIINEIPFYHTPMYDTLILECSRMMAVKKGMRTVGLGVEEFVRFNIHITRAKNNSVPKIIRTLGGWLFLSNMVRFFLKRVGRSASANGWPTKVSGGNSSDDYSMKICTKECGMVDFIKAVGEDDLIPYCSFFDFTTAESMGIGIKQLSSIDSGECVYIMSRRGSVEWPESIQRILK